MLWSKTNRICFSRRSYSAPKMKRVQTVLFSLLLPIGSGMGMAQWSMPSRYMQPPPVEQQQQPWSNNGPHQQQQSANFQKYLYNPSIPPSPMPLQLHHQQSSYQWNNQNQPQNNYQQQNSQTQMQQKPSRQKGQKPRVLVDYPFTVEYVDRNDPKRQAEDRKLVDIPFTFEYVDSNGNANNSPSNENLQGQGALRKNPDPLQFTSQQQKHQQQNYPRQNNHHQNPSTNPVRNNIRQNTGVGASGGYQSSGSASNACRLIRCY